MGIVTVKGLLAAAGLGVALAGTIVALTCASARMADKG